MHLEIGKTQVYTNDKRSIDSISLCVNYDRNTKIGTMKAERFGEMENMFLDPFQLFVRILDILVI